MIKKIFFKRPSLFLNAGFIVCFVILLKLICHTLGWEVLSVNPLLSGIIAANVFLMGFLLSGVMADYKESERLPGEIASGIESLVDEAVIVYHSKSKQLGQGFLDALLIFTQSTEGWFYKKKRTPELMRDLRAMQRFFIDLEEVTQANFIARLKQEQSNLRRILIRIRTIRDTSFIPSGYLIATTTTMLLMIGLILVKMEPFYESLFFVGVIAFLLSFLMLLIRDLDNPFGHYETSSTEDISLTPLQDVTDRIKQLQTQLETGTDTAQ